MNRTGITPVSVAPSDLLHDDSKTAEEGRNT